MRLTALIFNIIGIFTNFIIALNNTGPNSELYLAFAFAGAVIGIISICSLSSGRKRIFIGVLSTIFVSVLGGIFYLCWRNKEED